MFDSCRGHFPAVRFTIFSRNFVSYFLFNSTHKHNLTGCCNVLSRHQNVSLAYQVIQN